MKTPGEIYQPSKQPYLGTPEELKYPGMEVRKVNKTLGVIHYQKECYKLTASIGGWTVGLKRVGEEKMEIWFAKQLLGHLDESTRKFTGLAAPEKPPSGEESKKGG